MILKIAYQPYQVDLIDPSTNDVHPDVEDALGYCDNQYGEIRISIAQSPVAQFQTMLHEVIHAILYHQGIKFKNSEREERVVDGIATGLTQVLLDNTEVLKECIDSAKSNNTDFLTEE